MTGSRGALDAILDEHVAARGAAAIALAPGADADIDAAWTPRTLVEEPGFLTYSITKIFTAVLVLRLVEEGHLALEDPLSLWYPDVDRAERITLRRLLCHSAGIPDYGGLAAYHEAVRKTPGEPWSFERFAAETYEKGLLFEPGSGWAYANPGYMLLRRIAEEVAGEGYATLVSSRLAAPLGLHRTFVAETPTDLAGLAPATSSLISPDMHPRDTRDAYHPGWVSHGVVASTPTETARFVAALFEGALLSAASLNEMTTGVPVPDAPPRWQEPCYGLGLMGARRSAWGPVWGHGGGGPGTVTFVLHAPDLAGQGTTACAMCAVEEEHLAERVVLATLDSVRT